MKFIHPDTDTDIQRDIEGYNQGYKLNIPRHILRELTHNKLLIAHAVRQKHELMCVVFSGEILSYFYDIFAV